MITNIRHASHAGTTHAESRLAGASRARAAMAASSVFVVASGVRRRRFG
jgi:hypothetical protein